MSKLRTLTPALSRKERGVAMSLNESIVEEAALEWFGELGYAIGHGPHMAPGAADLHRSKQLVSIAYKFNAATEMAKASAIC